jgi:hypothetical protein
VVRTEAEQEQEQEQEQQQKQQQQQKEKIFAQQNSVSILHLPLFLLSH